MLIPNCGKENEFCLFLVVFVAECTFDYRDNCTFGSIGVFFSIKDILCEIASHRFFYIFKRKKTIFDENKEVKYVLLLPREKWWVDNSEWILRKWKSMVVTQNHFRSWGSFFYYVICNLLVEVACLAKVNEMM